MIYAQRSFPYILGCLVPELPDCSYTSAKQDVTVVAMDDILFSRTANDCQRFCDDARAFQCRSFAQKEDRCYLSGDDSVTLDGVPQPVEIGAVYKEKICARSKYSCWRVRDFGSDEWMWIDNMQTVTCQTVIDKWHSIYVLEQLIFWSFRSLASHWNSPWPEPLAKAWIYYASFWIHSLKINLEISQVNTSNGCHPTYLVANSRSNCDIVNEHIYMYMTLGKWRNKVIWIERIRWNGLIASYEIQYEHTVQKPRRK